MQRRKFQVMGIYELEFSDPEDHLTEEGEILSLKAFLLDLQQGQQQL